MKRALSLFAIMVVAMPLFAQSSMLLELEGDYPFILMLDGKTYATEGAKMVKIEAIPEKFSINYIAKDRMLQPVFKQVTTKEKTHYHYRIIDTSKVHNPSMALVAEKADADVEGDQAFDLGDNYIIFRFGNTQTLGRFKGEQSSSASAKFSREETSAPTSTIVEIDGKKQQTQKSEKKTQKSTSTKSVSHSERSGTIHGGAQYPNMLPPKTLKDCDNAWDKDTRDSAMAELQPEKTDAYRLYHAKLAARDHCLSTADAKATMTTLANEAAKIDYLKYVYASLTDRHDVSTLRDQFESAEAFDGLLDYFSIKYD